MDFFALALGLILGASTSAEWDRTTALNAIREDATRFLSKATLDEWLPGFNMYAKTREKGVKAEAMYVIGFAKFLASPLSDSLNHSQRVALFEVTLEAAVALNKTFIEMTPYIEGVPMRGWPFIIRNKTKINKKKIIEFESYQGGHIMQAVAFGAELAALHGMHRKAASLVLSVAAALHDGFLTADLKRTKVDSNGAVVYVPKGASLDRLKRSEEVQRGKTCLEYPH